MYVYGKARCQWQRAFFMFVQTHKKAALIIRKTKNQDFKNEKSKKTANDLLIAFIV